MKILVYSGEKEATSQGQGKEEGSKEGEPGSKTEQ